MTEITNLLDLTKTRAAAIFEGKTYAWEILDELKSFRRPLLVGVSRKRFIWQPNGLTPDTCGDLVREYEERAAALGADIIRTHL